MGKMGMKVSFLLVLFTFQAVSADLRAGFYKSTCPDAESIIFQAVQKRFNADKSVTAALLRMHFHDCFVRGCDASILIDSTSQNQAEKDSGPNQTVREYELIDEIKKALEAKCPSKVSCADIITVATRDAVVLSGGPNYTVPTGRRDGLLSRADDVNLPGPQVDVSQAFQIFRAKGLTLEEMVILLGAHTVGVAHCSFFSERLQNDPSMDANLAARLRNVCANPNTDPTVLLDQGTGFVVDNEFYKQLLLKRGIMHIDQQLAIDRSTSGFVSRFARDGNGFKKGFGNAMVKMGSIGVIVGNDGEVRKNCRVFNPKNKPTVPSPPPKVKASPPSKKTKTKKQKKPKSSGTKKK
ncbi:PEROXIDASE 25-RELATED [Salix purpurea]|uniref:Peroxidase n=1 Tax=Salix purpurea TaxID=77065 RepID=A0A9Q0W9M8_SALPP|nr:PEROXIDASE 25-RELATED [Salix purpurea]